MTVLNLARALLEELADLSHGTTVGSVPWDSSHTGHRRSPDECVGRVGRVGHPGQAADWTPDVTDVLERAAILEFSEGLPRGDADRLALGEAGFSSWAALVAARKAARDGRQMQ
jgi:hypothetical protein